MRRSEQRVLATHAGEKLAVERAAMERVTRDPTRVVAGTDCGFETSACFATVAPDVVWVKLRSLAEGARLASEHLFA